MTELLTTQELQLIKENRDVRVTLAHKSHYWFFSLYLSEYVQYPFAPFHQEMFAITEDTQTKISAVVAFRGSAKTTIMTTSFPIWAITGVMQKKFVLILSQTQQQARLHLTNIKRELENNGLLKEDIGPFEEFSDEWAANSIVLKNYGARIVAASTEQSIRGIKHGRYRPDLVICDDVEDLNSVKTREGRDRTFSWLTGEILPIGDESTKIVIVGNLLHEDCLLMRLKQHFEENKMNGRFLAVPLLSENEEIAWLGKYPDLQAIERQKQSIGNEAAWYREYLLRIIADADRVVHRDWIQYYEALPPTSGRGSGFDYAALGVDLAISEKASADYTAMVGALVFDHEEKQKIYIMPNPINVRMDFPTTVETVKTAIGSLNGGKDATVYIESVGYQDALIQWLKHEDVDVEGVKIGSTDKRTRLALTTHLIRNGNILFPRTGCEQLIEQMVGLGIEKHDDLADAFSILINQVMKENKQRPRVFFLSASDLFGGLDSDRGLARDLSNDPYGWPTRW